jgi:cellulose synthase/poly-beta-1,6-N-acetylglucosamine synthase-like glycosyltransferase
MFLGLFLTCTVALALMTILLVGVGHRIKFASRLVGLLLSVVVVAAAGEIAARVWDLPSEYVLAGEAVLLVVCAAVVFFRPAWNPVGQVAFASLAAAAISYLAFAAWYTAFGGLSVPGAVASGVLFFLEFLALILATYFAFESIDVLCRTKWERPIPEPDPAYRPKVSLQIAAYNEPPDMLIETIKSVETIDYPDFELVVIDNNTKDPAVWQPVEEYCRDRPRVKFVHVDELSGFKSGALNLALTDHTDPHAEIVGVIDADYLLDPDYLKSVVGHFADQNIAFVQTPQDYREYEGDRYLTACYDAYRYFFATSMPSRNERDSIIFAGTMGLLRRSVLEKLGGWDEWTITEDAEASLRMLKEGYSGLYIDRSFGKGIMPLTFATFKSQRFRWCFGGMQILRKHWRDLMPWTRGPENRLTTGQRVDYLFGSIQWLNDLIYLGFSIVLLSTATLLVTKGEVGIRPLLGAVVLLPSALIASGLFRAMWALRRRTGIGLARALRAFANWLSVSWTVALACVQGLIRRKGVFMRTPKVSEKRNLWSAFWSARAETVLAGLLWAAGVVVALRGKGTPFVFALFGWQGAVYATSPYMSWLNTRAELTDDLERRRRTEIMRERVGPRLALLAGTVSAAVAAMILAVILIFGGSNPGNPKNPFTVPHRQPGDQGPLEDLLGGGVGSEPSPAPTESPSPTSSPGPSPTESPSPSPEPSPTPTPTPTSSP